jgi:hypothetical protein
MGEVGVVMVVAAGFDENENQSYYDTQYCVSSTVLDPKVRGRTKVL